ncbi:anthrone oxygenase family protein [Gandjariella thermophila]|nr:anthrone oxygenase family protein [Gandjariella thermophila]
MKPRSGRRRAPWVRVARLGLAHWFFGNAYEAVVDVPRLLADAQPRRAPRLLAAGSPVRYYAPVAPVTLAATAATLADGWRFGDRRRVATAGAAVVSAVGLTGYLVLTTNRRLLQSPEPLAEAERRVLVARWHRVNLVRLAALTVAAAALRQATTPGRAT